MKMISKLNIFIALCMLSSMFAIDDPTAVCATGSVLDPGDGSGEQPSMTVTWEDSNPPEACGGDEVDDCDGSGECWTALWIGDGYPDCNDQQYGADLCCYDLDGGDCTEAQCDGDDSTDGGGATTGGTTGGGSSDCEECEFDWSAYGSECCDTAFIEFGLSCADLTANYGWDCAGCACPGDSLGAGNGGNGDTAELSSVLVDKALMMNAVDIRDLEEQDAPQDRSINATITYSCDACLDGGPWSYAWTAATATGATGFTVYGFDAGAEVCASVALSSSVSGETSSTVEAGCALAGDATSQSCSEGGCATSGTGDVNADGGINVLDIVAIVNVILGGSFADDCAALSADLNGDGTTNVLDIVAIVNVILGNGRAADATSVELIKDANSLNMQADGYIGGIQMTLSHGDDFILNLTEDAMVADYSTQGQTTTLVIVKPESDELFTTTGDFVIKDMIVANSQGAMDVSYAPQTISLSKAYPNPFNPSTTINMNLHQDGFASVKVYSLTGQQIAVLAEGNMLANTYSLTWDAKDVPSGMYMIRAESAGQMATEKLMLLK